MGYRSDVKAVILFDDGDEQRLKLRCLMEKMKATRLYPTTDDMQSLWDTGFFDHIDEHGQIRFENGDVKWYPHYSDVQQIEKVFEEVGEAGGFVEFVRLGEEPDDYEAKEYGETPDDYDSPICYSHSIAWE